MTSFALTLFSSRTVSTRTASTPSRNYVWMNAVLFVLLAVVGISYIVLVNQSASAGYRMDELEQRLSVLQQETQKLEVIASNARSLERVTRGVRMLNLVPSASPTYVRLGTPSVAVR